MDRIKNVNPPLLFLNLVFLMAVAAIPFPTALLADYLQAGHDERLASAIYGATMAVMGIAFGIIWAYAVLSEDLLHDKIDPDRARRSLLIFAAGNPLCSTRSSSNHNSGRKPSGNGPWWLLRIFTLLFLSGFCEDSHTFQKPFTH